ncbi:MAG: pyruvate dehydrogenase (acetyl-transferring) E1 component subunit alpha [Bacteroidales bacterium]|jgi:pyruvate dehydrogenase E1 component alpha subunit
MFDEYNPLEEKIFQVIDNDGKIINEKWFPEIENERLLKAYKDMLFARTADLLIVSYQRQGRIYTYPPSCGQEAIQVATAMVMHDEDWLVPAFRELAAYLGKGVTLKEIFLYYMGFEDGSKFLNAKNILPISVPVSSQLLHAAGIGYEIKYNKKEQVVFAFVGDGGTSEGDFHESLNFSGVWKVPVVFIVQNNQYGISTPVSKQTASKNIAIKSYAYGIKGVKVDGNDIFAMFQAIKIASEYSRSESKPVLIEALTYRKGSHTTSDDPTLYRTTEEEKEWDLKDPVKRLKAYLFNNNLWTEEQDQQILQQFKQEVDRRFIEAENYPSYKLEDVFKYMYADIPDDLKRQQNEHENFLKWKEARK